MCFFFLICTIYNNTNNILSVIVQYDGEKYKHVFSHMQEWLERTPGLEVDGFNFWEKLEINIFDRLNQEKEKIEV